MQAAVAVTRWRGAEAVRGVDRAAAEEPLEVRVNDAPFAVTMRTPGQDRALAVGLAVSEGIAASPLDVYDVTCCSPEAREVGGVVTVYVPPDRAPVAVRAQRYATSSCGLCGRDTLEAALCDAPPFKGGAPAVRAAMLYTLPDRMRQAQRVFGHTGGLHAAALFRTDGGLLYAAEDVGRHNAVDKVVGAAMLAGQWPLDGVVLMVSGRAGFEVAQKALMARIPAVCSVSAPSSLAVDLGLRANMLLVGFLRGETMNVYAGGERLVP